eukprot:ctg_653.g279
MTTDTSRTLQLEEANSLAEKDPTQAEQLYRSLLNTPMPEGDESTEAAQREREVAVYGLVDLWARQGRAADLVQLSQVIREQFDRVAKAKMAKMIRTLLDALGRVSRGEAYVSAAARRGAPGQPVPLPEAVRGGAGGDQRAAAGGEAAGRPGAAAGSAAVRVAYSPCTAKLAARTGGADGGAHHRQRHLRATGAAGRDRHAGRRVARRGARL